MFTVLFFILFIAVFGNVLGLAIKATWGITKILFSLVFMPILLIIFVVVGLLPVAFIGLAIYGGYKLLVKN